MKIIRILLCPLAAISLTSAAHASSVVVASCDPVTDGDTAGCLFTGNINGNDNPANVNSYGYAQNGYNVWAAGTGNPAITLNFLTASDLPGFGTFGSITGGDGPSGTFDLSTYDIEYFAVKSGNEFVLYEYLGADGTGDWATRTGRDLSHIAFFGTPRALPEPGTWAMMLIGFGAIGASMRSKRRRATALHTA